MVFVMLGVLVVLGGMVAFTLGWKHYHRHRHATATYRVILPPGTTMQDAVDAQRALMASDQALKEVAAEFDLADHWNLESEAEVVALFRQRLRLSPGTEPDQLKVVFSDRDGELAMDVLRSLDARYVEQKKREAGIMERPSGEGAR
jgi:hypothetical protein